PRPPHPTAEGGVGMAASSERTHALALARYLRSIHCPHLGWPPGLARLAALPYPLPALLGASVAYLVLRPLLALVHALVVLGAAGRGGGPAAGERLSAAPWPAAGLARDSGRARAVARRPRPGARGAQPVAPRAGDPGPGAGAQQGVPLVARRVPRAAAAAAGPG